MLPTMTTRGTSVNSSVRPSTVGVGCRRCRDRMTVGDAGRKPPPMPAADRVSEFSERSARGSCRSRAPRSPRRLPTNPEDAATARNVAARRVRRRLQCPNGSTPAAAPDHPATVAAPSRRVPVPGPESTPSAVRLQPAGPTRRTGARRRRRAVQVATQMVSNSQMGQSRSVSSGRPSASVSLTVAVAVEPQMTHSNSTFTCEEYVDRPAYI